MAAVLMAAPGEGNTTQRLPSGVFREPGPWATQGPRIHKALHTLSHRKPPDFMDVGVTMME